MADSDLNQAVIDAAQELEQIEDELSNVTGMEGFRDRPSSVRQSLVETGLQQQFVGAVEDADNGDTLLYDEARGNVENLSDE